MFTTLKLIFLKFTSIYRPLSYCKIPGIYMKIVLSYLIRTIHNLKQIRMLICYAYMLYHSKETTDTLDKKVQYFKRSFSTFNCLKCIAEFCIYAILQ